MCNVTIEEAQAKLGELIDQAGAGEEVIITRNNQPVARLVPATAQKVRQLGTLQGTVTHMAADFDAPLDEMQEYAP